MRKKILKYGMVFVICLIMSLFACNVSAEETVDEADLLIEEQMKTSEMQKITEQFENYADNCSSKLMEDYDPEKIIADAAKGSLKMDMPGFLKKILMYLFDEIFLNINIMIKLVVLVILCAILKNLQTSFLSENVGEMAFYACYIVIISILIVSFNSAMQLGREIIDNIVGFMHATIPVLIALMVSGGNIASGGIFEPVMIAVVEISGTIMKNVFMPLVFFSMILSVIGNISEKIQVTRLISFLKQINGWGLGLILTIFVGIVSLQGSLGALVDGVTSKTAKFAITAAIPVAGKYLADASETVIACTLLIRNAAGVAAMIGVILMCMAPLMKMFALLLVYKLTCIIIEPISEKRITGCMNELSNSLTHLLGISASVMFMFLITITAIIGASNISAMIR